MTSPNLVIRRLVVKGEIGCDLTFNYGLNVVKSVANAADPKSTNKCGKTSLVELMQHGLGRRQASRLKWYFAPIASQIDTLWMEIEAGNRIMTIQRSLKELSANIRVHDGPYAPGMDADPGEVVTVEGMSDFMLDALGIPKVSVKQADGTPFPLSFPTLMRAFILHQEDSFGQILDKMIPEQRRSDVIGFLTKITPIERFTLEDQLGSIQRQIVELESRTKAVEAFLLENGLTSPIEIQSRYEEAGVALQHAEFERLSLQDQIRGQLKTEPVQGHIDDLHRQLMQLKEIQARLGTRLSGLTEEESRLEELLNSLRSDSIRAKRLQSSHTVLSTIDFDICPRCTTLISEEMKDREKYGRCSLCNRILVQTSDSLPRSSSRADDIGEQIDETESVLRDVRKDRREAEVEIAEARLKHDSLADQLDAESRSFVSPAVDALMLKARAVADLEAARAALEPLLLQGKSLQAMRQELLDLRLRQSRLQDQLRAAAKPDANRIEALSEIYRGVLEKVRFPDLRDVGISSQSLLPFINGQLYVHVGTALKGLATVCYHLAILEYARKFESFFPTFLMVDSPAVGDLNDENHTKLLSYIAQLEDASPLELDWQVILTTRRSNESLDGHVIETLSSPGRMLLRAQEH